VLTTLRVKNLAVVEETTLECGPGLNVISGETGAGKSILIGAIELLFGGRADADLIRAGADMARVEGLFEFDDADFFRRRGLDQELSEKTLLLVREVSRGGRSKALVNDELATVARLKALGEAMADLHGQHEHQRLLRPDTHVDYLDRYAATQKGSAAGALTPLDLYREARARWLLATTRLRDLDARGGTLAERRDTLSRAVRELEAAALKPGEETDLRAERSLLVHAEKLLAAVAGALDDLEEGDAAIETRLGQAVKRLTQAAALDPRLEAPARQIGEALVALEEAARDLARYRDGLHVEPGRAEWIEERLQLLSTLRRKYGNGDVDLIARRAALAAELDGLADETQARAALEAETAKTAAEVVAAGRALREWREAAAAKLVRGVRHELDALGMKEARLHVRQEPVPADAGLDVDGVRLEPGEKGFERVEFFLEANPGEEPRPLAKTASGGELSRVMLGLKAVLRAVDPLPILLFDEVDAGIGGRVATEVGIRLHEIAAGRQVFVITHLPMIAARGDRHFRVEKRVEKGRTVTRVEPLSAREREAELARMLAGGAGGDEARKTAKALLEDARKGRG
jgi:DNA repair protein RecN (Recombination protein N)